jgi:hypothetical protein
MRLRLSEGAFYWPSVALGVASLVLVVTNVILISQNQVVQAQVNQRQQFINQSIQLSRVNDVLVRLLANAAVSAKDDKLRDLLAQQGITVTASPSASGSTTPAQPAAPAASAPATPPATTPTTGGATSDKKNP